MKDTSDWSLLILSRQSTLAPSSRLRTFQYIPYLESHGATVDVASFFDEAYLKGYFSTGRKGFLDVLRAYVRRIAAVSSIRNYSMVWIEKEVFPFLPAIFEAVPSLVGVPYVVDYDDATFHTYDTSNNFLVRALLSDKLRPLIRGATAVTVGNKYLEDYVIRNGAKQAVRIPTVVDTRRYQVSP